MKNKMLFPLTAAFIVCCLAAVDPLTLQAKEQGQETLLVEAKKEGKVTIYGSATGDTSRELSKAFKNKYGIDLEFLVGRGDEIFEKLLRERRAGLYLADAAIGGASPFFDIPGLKDIAVPLEPLVQEEVKDPTRWRAGKISFLDERKSIIALVANPAHYTSINTELIKEGEIKSFNDLLAPKWKGKIVINDPTINGRGQEWFVFMLREAYGKEKGTDYMKKLALQEPMISRDGRLQVEWVAKGKYPVGLGLKTTMMTSFIQVGAPIKFIAVKEGAPLITGSLNLYAFDKPPHPNGARLFLNWILSREAGEIMQRTSGFTSERADVSKKGLAPIAVPGPNDAIKQAVTYGEAELREVREVAVQVFKNVMK